ncbi:MAG: Rrf2 family transcriptional regulator [Candidatus Brocadiae bacterium]|nr:Rrf2 family transcriptional regulator [Candidatus Brocadiia bacterium]
MKISAKAEYACLAMFELAKRQGSPRPTQIHVVAEAQAIPSQYLVQILIQLQRAGLVRSERGAKGGYRLAREPQDISVGEVLRVIDGPLMVTRGAGANETEEAGGRHFREIWSQVQEAMSEVVDRRSFADLVLMYEREFEVKKGKGGKELGDAGR